MRRRTLGPVLVGLVLVGVALALRWRYVQEVSLFVDEFVTAWAARNVWDRGLPVFPSGNLYPHGFLFSYLEAPFVRGAFDGVLARVPALILSLAAVPLLYWVGRRLFSAPVGLVAAAALAVDPDAIVWGGRARMYSLLQLLVLLVLFFAYGGLVRDRPRDRWLAMGLLVLAIFTHAEAMLLLPVLALTALILWPWRRLLRPGVVLPFALGAAGALAFTLLSGLGQPGHLQTLAHSRPYLSFSLNLPGNLQAFAPVFFQPHHLPFTLLAVAGLFPALRPPTGGQGEEWGHSPLTFLYTVLALFLTLFLLLAGATWQNERYLFLLWPALYLVGSAVLDRLVARAAHSLRPGGFPAWKGGVLLALAVALFVGLAGAPGAYSQEPGYDLAFRYLRQRWQPGAGDRVLTFSPPAAMLYLDHCDCFAVQRDYKEYVVARPGDGLPADLWTATPLLDTTAGLVELLASAPRVWFVVDEWRFQTRYEPDFVLAVLDAMEVAYHERQVMVFRGEGYTPPPSPAVKQTRQADFGGELLLTGFDLFHALDALSPGDALDVTLHWQALTPRDADYTVFLELVGPGGQPAARVDGALLRGLYHPGFWSEGDIVPDRHRLDLPAGLPPGHYRLDVGLYHAGSPARALPSGQDAVALTSLSLGAESP